MGNHENLVYEVSVPFRGLSFKTMLKRIKEVFSTVSVPFRGLSFKTLRGFWIYFIPLSFRPLSGIKF